MNQNIKRLMQSTFAVAITLGAVGVQARPSHWIDHSDDRIRNGEIVNLGEVTIGNSDHHYDADTLDLFNNPRLQCRLTHVKLTAYSDSVLITRIDVEYRDADQYGQYKDSIDLSEEQGPGHGHNSGIYLDAGRSSRWLDVDDVKDGHPDGRCIKSLRIYGIDTPDYNDHGSDHGHDYDHGHGPGYGHGSHGHGHGNNGDNFRPAHIRVDGLVGRDFHSGPSHHEPSHEPSHHHEYKYAYLGTTGLMRKLYPEFRTINVGKNQGRFDGIKLIAKDDDFEIKSVEVIFANGQRIRKENVQLMEGQEVYVDFDDFGSHEHDHGHMDRDRFIDQITVFGDAANPFGSKAQLEIWGGR